MNVMTYDTKILVVFMGVINQQTKLGGPHNVVLCEMMPVEKCGYVDANGNSTATTSDWGELTITGECLSIKHRDFVLQLWTGDESCIKLDSGSRRKSETYSHA